MLLVVTGGDEAPLRAAHHRAGHVQEGPQGAPPGDDELFGNLRPVPPLLERSLQILQVRVPDHILLPGHRHVAHNPVEEALQPDQQLRHVTIRLGAGETYKRGSFVHVAEDDNAGVALGEPTGAEEGRGTVVAAAGRDGRVLLAGHTSSLCGPIFYTRW